MKQQRLGFGLWQAMAAATLLLLAGCAAGAGGGGQAVLPPPPAEITPMSAQAHEAALRAPKMRDALMLDAKGDSAGAIAAYRSAADNPIAHYMLGLGYASGEGVAADQAEAARQYYQAAMAGYAPAQSYLGDRYEKGEGVARDQAMANRWYRFAAQQGEDSATGRLAMSMIEGDGMPRDVDGALKLLHHCAEPPKGEYHPSGYRGGPSCQAALAVIYLEGVGGVPVDLTQAVSWMTKAAEQHMPVAEKHLAILYETGKGVAKDDKQAEYWRARAAADAGRHLGDWTQL